MAINFETLLGRIGEAAIHAQRAASHYALQQWLDLCEENEDGTRSPKTIRFRLNEHKTVEVAELAMTHPSVMPLSELTVEFEAQVDFSSAAEPTATAQSGDAPVSPAPHLRLTAKRGLFGRSTHFNVTAKFTMADPPESMEALRDALANQLKNELHS